MIRTPITDEIAFAWWREALINPPDAVPDDPMPGYYTRRLVRGGVQVPCKIWLSQEVDEAGELIDQPRLMAEMNGDAVEPEDLWSYVAGNPITEQMFRYLVARADWAWRYSPADPFANPRKPVDHLSTPVLF